MVVFGDLLIFAASIFLAHVGFDGASWPCQCTKRAMALVAVGVIIRHWIAPNLAVGHVPGALRKITEDPQNLQLKPDLAQRSIRQFCTMTTHRTFNVHSSGRKTNGSA